MSKNEDEFKNVKKGLPEENIPQKTNINYILLFTVVGIIFSFFILTFQDVIFNQGEIINQAGTSIPEQVIVNSVLALLVGAVQAWIFKRRIKSRIYLFVGFSILGGCLAGVAGGLLINSGNHIPALVGFVNGALAGGISSIGQNMVMRNQKYKSKWFYFSIYSWAIIFSITWVIGWKPDSGIDMALSALFLMIASGVSLVFFLNTTPQIEFS